MHARTEDFLKARALEDARQVAARVPDVDPGLLARYLRQWVAVAVDAELQIHIIADNLATHKHAKVKAWLAKHPRVPVDDQGNLWIGVYTDPRSRSRTWQVFSSEGTPSFRLDLPSNLEVQDIRGGLIVGVAVDELGVQRIVGYGYRVP